MQLPSAERRPWFEEAVTAFLAPVLNLHGDSFSGLDVLANLFKGSASSSSPERLTEAAENRFADGLLDQSTTFPNATYYDSQYRSPEGTLPFCLALPQNDGGLQFDRQAIVEMYVNAVFRLHEVHRQGHSLGPLHIVSLYVYTYELPCDGHQIYRAMNRAMRQADGNAIAFWRPLIWQVDCALQSLPPFSGKVYRGIDIQVPYEVGHTVCWPVFPSASATQSVAREFVKVEQGTLFFLLHNGARAVSQFSQFPEEDEVIFRANTQFKVISALLLESDIGQFYVKVDNIVVKEFNLAEKPMYVWDTGVFCPPL